MRLPERREASAAAKPLAERADEPRQQTSRAQPEEAAPNRGRIERSGRGFVGNRPARARPVIVEFEKDSYVTSEGDGSVRLVIRRTGSTRRASDCALDSA